jgi:hypothetical protein
MEPREYPQVVACFPLHSVELTLLRWGGGRETVGRSLVGLRGEAGRGGRKSAVCSEIEQARAIPLVMMM